MNGRLKLKVVTPEGSILDKDVASVTARSEIGELCILPEHRPLLAALLMGRFLVESLDGDKTEYVLDTGFFEAASSHVNVITQKCLAVQDIDTEKVTAELLTLSEEIKTVSDDDPRREDLELKIAWNQALIDSVSSHI